jgi:hypothetical protein
MAPAGGVHVYFVRSSNRGRIEEWGDVKGASSPKSDVNLVRRFGGLIYVRLTRAGPHSTAFQVGVCPRRYRSRLPTGRTACRPQEDN